MRVVVFVDGQNFHQLKGSAETPGWRALADWIAQKTGGRLVETRYYMGTVPGSASDIALDEIGKLEGFFVLRFPLRPTTTWCEDCGKTHVRLIEKEVDTSIVADIVRMAAQDLFDVAVVVSGDADMAPALDAVRAFGKQGWVAAWDNGISARLRQAAWGYIRLADSVERRTPPQPVKVAPQTTTHEAPQPVKVAPRVTTHEEQEARLLYELAAAETKMPYVGANHFMAQWAVDSALFPTPADKNAAVNRLVAKGSVRAYRADDGTAALALVSPVRTAVEGGGLRTSIADLTKKG